jgi:hypothetical protein
MKRFIGTAFLGMSCFLLLTARIAGAVSVDLIADPSCTPEDPYIKCVLENYDPSSLKGNAGDTFKFDISFSNSQYITLGESSAPTHNFKFDARIYKDLYQYPAVEVLYDVDVALSDAYGNLITPIIRILDNNSCTASGSCGFGLSKTVAEFANLTFFDVHVAISTTAETPIPLTIQLLNDQPLTFRSVTASVGTSAAPEPSTLSLILLFLAGLAGNRLRRERFEGKPAAS